MIETVTLCFFALLAGLIDSIAGGGGLIQLPATITALIASFFGTRTVTLSNR